MDGLSPNRLLSIDWDYVTGDCSVEYSGDPHPHCGYCKGYYGSKGRGHEKHLDSIWEEKEEKLLKLRMYSGTPLFVAECHANIMDLLEYYGECPEVFDYDAHRDKYDRDYFVHCGNWIHHLEQLGGQVFARPRVIKKVGAVFICHSSPWTPRSMDNAFFQFVHKVACKLQVEPRFIGHRQISLRNGYGRVNG